MTSLALPTTDLFSIITTADRGGRLPGWRSLLGLPGHGEAHVDYAAGTLTQRNLWAVRLDEAVLRADKPVLLLASGESCLAAAWWARLSPASYVSKVAGALLFAPGAADAGDKFAAPRVALPFPSAIVDGTTLDQRVLEMAQGWGSEFAGPSEPAPWQHAQALVMRLTARVVEHDMRIAGTLGVRA